MNHPKNLYEEASYELNQFRERRVADRRFRPRDTPDRRVSNSSWPAAEKEDAKVETKQ